MTQNTSAGVTSRFMATHITSYRADGFFVLSDMTTILLVAVFLVLSFSTCNPAPLISSPASACAPIHTAPTLSPPPANTPTGPS